MNQKSEMEENRHQLTISRRLIARLERLSADSTFAHRASGLRGALLRAIERLEAGEDVPDLDIVIDRGFEILIKAAREINSQE